MKIHILFFLLTIFTIINSQKQTTKLIFLSQYENEQQQDYIQLGLTVKAQGTSLVNAMNQASKIAEQIKKIAMQFCQAHLKKKSECKNIVQIGNYQIKPKYKIIKRQSKFMGFEVQHEVKIKVLPVDHISDLADTILLQKNTKILSFQWKPLQQANTQQAAVSLGTQQGQQLCYELGMHLNRIQNVQQITQKSNQNVSVYKFEIQCQEGRKQKKKTDKKEKKSQNNEKQKKKKDQKKDNKVQKGQKTSKSTKNKAKNEEL